MTFNEVLHKLVERQDLLSEQARFALLQIIDGKVTESEGAAFLFGMRMKGETIDELTSFVQTMREKCVQVEVDTTHAVDLCGTGGDHSGTFNISTASMFVVAGAGVPVLKHGNRSVSSQTGSADVLEELGVKIDLKKEQVEHVFEQTNMAFMFAPLFHPAMKEIMPIRRHLKMRTFFNILGPLMNPASVRRQVVGAFNKQTAHTIIRILANLQTEMAFGVYANDGLDEVSISSETNIFELKHAVSSEAMLFKPQDVGLSYHSLEDIKGGNKQENAEIIRAILKGKATKAQTDVVILNSAFGILASGLQTSIEDSIRQANESIQSGNALQKMEEFVEATHSHAKG